MLLSAAATASQKPAAVRTEEDTWDELLPPSTKPDAAK
jgi:hypothetical protein